MKIQIHSDRNITMHAKLSTLLESEVQRILNRYEHQLTRIEVHLTNETGDKRAIHPGQRCLIEARPRHYHSLTATNDATDLEAAVAGAAAKMQRLLDTTFGRLTDRHKYDSPRTGLLELAAE